jgi:Transcriptional regulator C-terminal region
MFEHGQGYLRLYRALVGKQSGAIVAEHMQQMITELVGDELAMLAPHDATPVPRELVVQYTVSAFLGLLTWWADHEGPYRAAEMDAIFQQLTLPGVFAALECSEGRAESKHP